MFATGSGEVADMRALRESSSISRSSAESALKTPTLSLRELNSLRLFGFLHNHRERLSLDQMLKRASDRHALNGGRRTATADHRLQFPPGTSE
jgi:hypothetical protein